MKLRLAPNPRNYLSFFSYLASLCSSLVRLPDICLQIIILGNFTILVHVSFGLFGIELESTPMDHQDFV